MFDPLGLSPRLDIQMDVNIAHRESKRTGRPAGQIYSELTAGKRDLGKGVGLGMFAGGMYALASSYPLAGAAVGMGELASGDPTALITPGPVPAPKKGIKVAEAAGETASAAGKPRAGAAEVAGVTGEAAPVAGKSAREIVDDTWTTVLPDGRVQTTEIQVRSVLDPSMVHTGSRRARSHGDVAEAAGGADQKGLYGTTVVKVDGEVSEVLIGSDAFKRLPREDVFRQREIIAEQYGIKVEKV